mmetsp:Transcript_65206/g.142056  ORF Transcript_65206/g.142056 Transcript_65206/m.142056 type:complete len:185 (+) Transcript_65206:83-637(+)|eukprot:CAMPEP_0170582870 /NCGR_PEP_ID=MMETSP0224-20130122/7819_1 /TAXON_ID=285029 /ORGANISM="Togula jolla, Strain CCCM 725" /LENGTH=184 /DNA_ID=CAMNT_0010906133 /DNA_START=79 /DNA_END=633 /DNA_ORIENTATION=-
MKAMKYGATSVQKGIFPLHLDQGQEKYEKNADFWMMFVLIIQTVLVVLRFFLLMDLSGGFMMTLAAGLGWFSRRHHLYIPMVAAWGLFCFILGLFDMVTQVFSLFLTLFRLHLFSAIVRVCIPIADFLGALLAWQLFKDHEAQGGALSFLFADEKTGAYGAAMLGAAAMADYDRRDQRPAKGRY